MVRFSLTKRQFPFSGTVRDRAHEARRGIMTRVIRGMFPSRPGFTLVEVLIGITILIMGFVPVYYLMLSSEKQSVETTRKVQALALAHTTLEEIKSLPVHRIHSSSAEMTDEEYFKLYAGDMDLKEFFTVMDEATGKEFSRYITVLEGDPRCIQVKVRVIDTWTETRSAGNRSGTLLSALVIW